MWSKLICSKLIRLIAILPNFPPQEPILTSILRSISALILLLAPFLCSGCKYESSALSPRQGNQTLHQQSHKTPSQSEETPREDIHPPPQATATLQPPLNSIFRMIAQGGFEPARQQLSDFIIDNPNNGEAKFLLGLSHHRQKRYALAKPYFEEAAKLSPFFHPTFHFKGWCLYYLGEIDDSYAAFKEHVRLSPKEGDSIFGMGLIEMELDKLDDAESHFQTAIDLQIDNPRRVRDVAKIHARLADIYIRRENFIQAEQELLQALKLWPQHYIAHYKLHVVLNRLGKEEQAQEEFKLYKRGQAQAAIRRGIPGAGQ